MEEGGNKRTTEREREYKHTIRNGVLFWFLFLFLLLFLRGSAAEEQFCVLAASPLRKTISSKQKKSATLPLETLMLDAMRECDLEEAVMQLEGIDSHQARKILKGGE